MEPAKKSSGTVQLMDAETVLAILRRHEPEIRAAGVNRASIFGSMARGTAGPDSDVDIAVRFTDEVRGSGLEYVGRFLGLQARLEALLGRPVDIVPEPARKASFRQEIERDRIVAFE